MNLVIHELARVLAPSGRIVMVNDNVRYHGEEIPVDLILSDFAEKAGLSVELYMGAPAAVRETAVNRWASTAEMNCGRAYMYGPNRDDIGWQK